MSRFLSTGLSTLSSIRNQLTELTTEVLNESTQEVADPVTELNLSRKRLAELEQALNSKNEEVERLRVSNVELQERVSAFEYELHQTAERYRREMAEKEAEILHLNSLSLATDFSPSSATHATRAELGDSFSPPLSPSGHEFERRKLEEEMKHLKAECQHWKQLVKREGESSVSGDEMGQLRNEVQDLQGRMHELVEKHQDELSALQEAHKTQLAAVIHKQSRADNEDGWGADSGWDNDEWNAFGSAGKTQDNSSAGKVEDSSGGTTELQERLAALQVENERLKKENENLERSLEELDAEHAAAVEKLLNDRKKAEDAASKLEREIVAMKESSKTVEEAVDSSAEHEKLNCIISDLQRELSVTTAKHQETLDLLRGDYEEQLGRMILRGDYEDQLGRMRDEMRNEKLALEQEKEQLSRQCRELSSAYDELNGMYETEKARSGAAVGNNQDLHQKLETLRRDLSEYEEKYERCKADNQNAMKLLETLNGEFERLKSEYLAGNAAHVQTKKWRTEVTRLTKELEDSLKKREELVKHVQEFQIVVDRFDRQIQRFRSENDKLRKENEELRTASGASSPADFRRVFEDTDQQLQTLRRSLVEYQDAFVKKERVWRDQMEALKEENESLKTRSPSTPGSGRASDSGGEAPSSGSASYVHIEMANMDGGNIGQPSPHSGSNDSAGIGGDHGERRESREMIFVEEESREHDDWNTFGPAEEHVEDQGSLSKPNIISDDRETVKELNEQLAALQVDKKQLQETIEYVQIENGRLREEVLQLRSSLETIDAEHTAAVEKLLSDRKNAEERTNEAEMELEKCRQEIVTMRERRRTAEEKMVQVENVQSDHKELVDSIANLQSEIVAKSQQLEIAASEYQKTLDELKNKYERQIEQLREEMDKMKHEKSMMGQEEEQLIGQYQQRLDELKNKYEQQLDQLREEMDKVKNEQSTMEREKEQLIGQHQRTVDELRNEYERQIEQLREEMDKVANEKPMMEQEKEKVIEQYEQRLKDLKNTYEQQLEQLREEMDKMKHEKSMMGQEEEQLIGQYQQRLDEMKNTYEQQLEQLREEMEKVKNEQSTMEREKEQLIGQYQQLYTAYQQVHNLYESEKTRSASSQEMNQTLERTQRELEEFKEKYERAKKESEQGMKQLEMVLKEKAAMELDAAGQRTGQLREQLKESEEALQRQSKELERLRSHLMEMEDGYTHEAVRAEERETDLRNRLREAEQQLQAYLESSKDGTQKMSDQISDLRTELHAAAEQRDSALLQYADSQIELERQQKAVANLQAVLQHLQQERDVMVVNEVNRYKRESDAVKEEKRVMENKLRETEKHLLECERKLHTIASLSEVSSEKDRKLAELKAEVNAKEEECAALHTKLNELQKTRDAKIEKDVLKNILLGYFCAPSNKKPEIAHLLGAILGFSDEEFKKIDQGVASGGWLQFLRVSGGHQSSMQGKSTEQSLAAQFVKFLEMESAPKPPAVPMSTAFSDQGGSNTPAFPASRPMAPSQTSRSSSPNVSHQLPTFTSPTDGRTSDFLRDLLSKSGEDNVI